MYLRAFLQVVLHNEKLQRCMSFVTANCVGFCCMFSSMLSHREQSAERHVSIQQCLSCRLLDSVIPYAKATKSVLMIDA